VYTPAVSTLHTGLVSLVSLVIAGCGGGASRGTAPERLLDPAPARDGAVSAAPPPGPAPTGASGHAFAGCRGETDAATGGASIVCDDFTLVMTVVTTPASLSEAEVLDRSVTPPGRELGRGVVTYAGAEHPVRTYGRTPATAAPATPAAMVTVMTTGAGSVVMQCTAAEGHALDRDRCVAAFGTIVAEAVPQAMRDAPPVDAPGEVDFAGRPLKLAAGCVRNAATDVKCADGQMSWTLFTDAAQAAAQRDRYVDLLVSGVTGGGGKIESRRTVGCKLDGARTTCTIIEMSSPTDKLGKVRAYLAAATVRDVGVLILSSHRPAAGPTDRIASVPAPCRDVLAID
jgi:hypothetical protein